MAKLHRSKNRSTIKKFNYRFIPYDEIIDALNDDGEVFLEQDSERPLKRGTIWRASKKLSKMMGKEVRYDRALLRVDGVDVLEGYSFSLEDPESQPQKDTA